MRPPSIVIVIRGRQQPEFLPDTHEVPKLLQNVCDTDRHTVSADALLALRLHDHRPKTSPAPFEKGSLYHKGFGVTAGARVTHLNSQRYAWQVSAVSNLPSPRDMIAPV
jgi:hypothetical protein